MSVEEVKQLKAELQLRNNEIETESKSIGSSSVDFHEESENESLLSEGNDIRPFPAAVTMPP